MSTQPTTLELIRQRKPRHALSRELYRNEEVYQQDLSHIWYRDWVFAGHSFEIEKAGDFITLTIGDFPIVIVRDDQGAINAFHNACRHRGSRICSAAKGKNAKLVCPYHKWTYGLNGKLLFAGNMGDAFDNNEHNLQPVHCEVVQSFIYVCVAQNPTDFSEFTRDVTPFLLPHKLDQGKVAFESNIIEKANWKLVFENNRECYHCDANHPELLQAFVENLSVAGVGGEDDPELVAHWDKCEAAGFPSRIVMDEKGRYRMTRIPLSAGAVSYTMDGKPAVNGRMDDSSVDDIGALLYFNYPSTWNHFLGDHALSFRILPLSSGETLVTTKWIVAKDAIEGVDYDIDRLTKVWLATNNQDLQLVEETFRGVSSPAYIPGPFSDIAENGVCQFVDWYCEIMEQRCSEE
jgi:Rieske 2Fe-2S family protein